eukprot:TRINITY_DN10542_c0_g1_i1.p1 TRINITY_DN10542_c0_g1~~TRINITY_DN10542_c0_g1_i1.p1  ORF type:complete len:458 (+),score=55.59 TRINITY_DN10542_c0_g1_i1:149-1522(+)
MGNTNNNARSGGSGDGHQKHQSNVKTTAEHFEWPGLFFYPTEERQIRFSLDNSFTTIDAFWFARTTIANSLLYELKTSSEFAHKKLEGFDHKTLLPSTMLMTTNPDLLGVEQISKRFEEEGEKQVAFENPLELVVWQLVLERLPIELWALASQVCRTFYLMLTPKLQAATPCLWGRWNALLQMANWKTYGSVSAPFLLSPEGGGIVVSPAEWDKIQQQTQQQDGLWRDKLNWRGDGWRNGRILNGAGMVPYGGNYVVYEITACRKSKFIAVTLGSWLFTATALLQIKDKDTLQGIYSFKLQGSIDHERSPGKLVAKQDLRTPDSLLKEFEPVLGVSQFIGKTFVLDNVVAFPDSNRRPVTFSVTFRIDECDRHNYGATGKVVSMTSSIRCPLHEVLVVSFNGWISISIYELSNEKEARSVVTCLFDTTSKQTQLRGDFVLKSETLIFQGTLNVLIHD